MPSLITRIGHKAARVIGARSDAAVKRFYKALRTAAKDDRPPFLDIEQTAPALRELDRNYAVIRAEVDKLMAQRLNLPSYHQIDALQTYISDSSPQKWKVFLLYVMGAKPRENRALCPQTSALLDKVPNIIEAFFSILEPGKSIPPHGNSYPGYIRYHLGIIIPKENPPTFRVKDRMYTWREGESILFDDSFEHEVYNKSASERVILLVDILRPLPWHLFLMNRIFAKGFLRFAYASGLLKNLEKFR
jgi:aspartyl/asparaginyl beta-hydroxylase (cupin superfamily)